MEIFLNIVFLILGMVFLIVGADKFVDGSSSIAKKLKIPSIIIGLTIVSLGTSLPELSVSLISALQNKADMSVSNVVGSNIFNTLVVLGLSSIIMPVVVDKSLLKFEFPLLIGISAVLLLFVGFSNPHQLPLICGIIFVLLLVLFIVILIKRAKKNKLVDDPNMKILKMPIAIIFVIIGVVGIWFGGECVTSTASFLAQKMGMSQSLVGLTIMAVGTSLPELVTSVVAAKKGENDIALGNVIGSNIFNILFILGTTATIVGIQGNTMLVSANAVIDLVILLGLMILTYIFALISKGINKKEGATLFVLYIAYMTYIILRDFL